MPPTITKKLPIAAIVILKVSIFIEIVKMITTTFNNFKVLTYRELKMRITEFVLTKKEHFVNLQRGRVVYMDGMVRYKGASREQLITIPLNKIVSCAMFDNTVEINLPAQCYKISYSEEAGSTDIVEFFSDLTDSLV